MCNDSTGADIFQHMVANTAEKNRQQSFSNLRSTAREGMASRNVSHLNSASPFCCIKSSFPAFGLLEYQHFTFFPNFTKLRKRRCPVLESLWSVGVPGENACRNKGGIAQTHTERFQMVIKLARCLFKNGIHVPFGNSSQMSFGRTCCTALHLHLFAKTTHGSSKEGSGPRGSKLNYLTPSSQLQCSFCIILQDGLENSRDGHASVRATSPSTIFHVVTRRLENWRLVYRP